MSGGSTTPHLDFTEVSDGDEWELFCRDFLVELGFVIEMGPGVGPDGGRDLIVSEQLKGITDSRKFTWLVSCKHNAHGGGSVGTGVEKEILDRVKQHNANGFFGFYSTIPSTSLIDRLKALRSSGDIEEYRLFDRKQIEDYIVRKGMAQIMFRYFPESYTKVRPVQKLVSDTIELQCEVCGRDLINTKLDETSGIFLVAQEQRKQLDIVSVHFVCRGACDDEVTRKLTQKGLSTAWDGLDDLKNPLYYLKSMLSYMNGLHKEGKNYSAASHESMKQLYLAMAQRTLRDVTDQEKERVSQLSQIEHL